MGFASVGNIAKPYKAGHPYRLGYQSFLLGQKLGIHGPKKHPTTFDLMGLTVPEYHQQYKRGFNDARRDFIRTVGSPDRRSAESG